MRKIPANQKAVLLMQRHGVDDSEKNVLQILELVQTEEDRKYWLLVKSYLDSLMKAEKDKEKKYYNSWDLR
jgi:hypothetical protein